MMIHLSKISVTTTIECDNARHKSVIYCNLLTLSVLQNFFIFDEDTLSLVVAESESVIFVALFCNNYVVFIFWFPSNYCKLLPEF